jgi:polysaccharide pyruvyl transferase WcaK-like protein
VATADVPGVRQLHPDLAAVLPPTVDIPYEVADRLAKKWGFGRAGYQYKLLALAALFCMPVQIVFSIWSVALVKLGVTTPYRARVFERLQACDLVVSHSDESFKETASLLPLNPFWVLTWWSMLIARTWEILVARAFQKPIVLFPNSIGPFRTLLGRALAKLALGNCSALLVRDATSFDIARRLALGSPASRMLTYDTALLFTPDGARHHRAFEASGKPVLGVAPGVYSYSITRAQVRHYVAAHAAALDDAIEQLGVHVVFLPHYISGFQNDDLAICNAIIRRMKHGRAVELIEVATVSEFKRLLDQTDVVVSSKMHPAVLAVSGQVPTVCIAYDHKQTSFFERLDMADCLLDIRDVSPRTLAAKIAHVWTDRDRLAAGLAERIPTWQAHTRESIRRALSPLTR